MHQISDKRLEECRKFLRHPAPKKTPEELIGLVEDLAWAIEELQLRRLEEKESFTFEPVDGSRSMLIFGSDEEILKYVEEKKITNDSWVQATPESLRSVLPSSVCAIKLAGTNPELWKEWEQLCHTYDAEAKGNA